MTSSTLTSLFLPSLLFFPLLSPRLLVCCSLPAVEAEYTPKGSYEGSQTSSKSTGWGARALGWSSSISLILGRWADLSFLAAFLPLQTIEGVNTYVVGPADSKKLVIYVCDIVSSPLDPDELNRWRAHHAFFLPPILRSPSSDSPLKLFRELISSPLDPTSESGSLVRLLVPFSPSRLLYLSQELIISTPSSPPLRFLSLRLLPRNQGRALALPASHDR